MLYKETRDSDIKSGPLVTEVFTSGNDEGEVHKQYLLQGGPHTSDVLTVDF